MTRNIKEFVNHARATPAAASRFEDDHVMVLLALCNGAAHLADQLDSIARQSQRDWSVVISDDGSTDNWLQVVGMFAESQARGRTWITSGPRRGSAQNFLSLARLAGPTVPYVAFSDQDDVWLHDKLARAVARLKTVSPGRPALYCGRTFVCEADLAPRRMSPLFSRPPGFANALVQNIGGGNTMVLNRPALDLVQDTARHADGIVSHDWWIYQLVSGAGGVVIYDTAPSLLYRQHAANQVGANDTLRASLARLHAVLRGRFRTWNAANAAALDGAALAHPRGGPDARRFPPGPIRPPLGAAGGATALGGLSPDAAGKSGALARGGDRPAVTRMATSDAPRSRRVTRCDPWFRH